METDKVWDSLKDEVKRIIDRKNNEGGYGGNCKRQQKIERLQ